MLQYNRTNEKGERYERERTTEYGTLSIRGQGGIGHWIAKYRSGY
ncbi:hypothetical protein IMSAGC019_00120 [Lachnospiraceae bacterium]|nr:hypothetical protein IMSAGC019_00120 [Lachnospiraceae bacterium]